MIRLLRPVRRRALVLLAGALAAPAFAAPAAAQILRDREPQPEVRKMEIEGVSNAVDERELRASIGTEPTRCTSAILSFICRFSRFRGFEERHYLNRQELARDVLRIRVFYYKHGFRETQVDTTVTQIDDKRVAVRFDIVEGPPTTVEDVRVDYDTTLISRRRLGQLVLLKKGAPLDLFVLDSTRIGFQNEMWEQGFADALIDTSTVVDAATRTARVQLRIVPNHKTTVGDIVVSGTSEVSPITVLNALSFRPGDLFRRSDVIESQRNLYESNLFRLAVLEVPETFDSVKTVNVLLREAPLREARTSAGFNTVDFIQTEGRFTNYNTFGGARRLELSATAGNLLAPALNGRGIFREQRADSSITGDAGDFLKPTWQASVSLTQPAFLQRARNSLSVGAFAQRRSVPAVVIDRGYGGNLTYTRQLRFRAPASVNYRFEVTRVEAGGPYFCVNFGVCDTLTIDALRSHQRLSPLQLLFNIDRSDQPLGPTRGYVARMELEHASQVTVSDYRYNRAFAEGAVYAKGMGRGSVLAGRVRLGFARPGGASSNGNTSVQSVLHPRKRFYAGGSQSVRGYGENQLGPRVLTLPHEYLVNARTASGAPCDSYSDAIRFCDPNTAADSAGEMGLVDDTKFTPRPLGGTSLVEASVEYRFPLPFLPSLGGAVFVDGAAVGERIFDPLGNGVRSLADLVRGTGAITPGFGVRYFSGVGPVRVDVGFNPSMKERLAVVSEIMRNGKREIIALDTPRDWSSVAASNGLASLLNRFTLHLSIGQAY